MAVSLSRIKQIPLSSWVVGSLVLVLLIWVVVPFLMHHNLQTWDMIGHYASAWFTQEYLFPAVTGWNPYFFAGFPQNYFYAPLFHYLAAALGFLIGLPLAFKLLMALAILALPVSAAYLARSLPWTETERSIFVAGVVMVFALLQEWFDGGLKATFTYGTVTNLVALPLFLWYVGLTLRHFAKRYVVLSSLVLALILLTHIITSFVAILFVLSLFIVQTRKLQHLKWLIGHAGITFGLVAFWLVPFFLNFSYSNSASQGFTGSLWTFLTLILIDYIGIVWWWRAVKGRSKSGLTRDELTIILFAGLTLILILFYQGVKNWLPLHFYRLQSFIYFLIPAYFVILFRLEGIRFPKRFALAVLVAAVLLISLRDFNIRGDDDVSFSLPEREGRAINLTQREDFRGRPQSVTHLIPMDSGRFVLSGLFMESAINAKYIASLRYSLEDGVFLWGFSEGDYADFRHQPPGDIAQALKLFWVSDAVTYVHPPDSQERQVLRKAEDKSEREELRAAFMNQGEKRLAEAEVNAETSLVRVPRLRHHQFTESELVESLSYPPKVTASNNWDRAVWDWWTSKKKIEKVLVRYDGEIEFAEPKEAEIVDIEYKEPWQRLSFRVSSDQDVPVLIKMSHFPNWKAQADGQPIPVYRASPNLMLVNAHGDIEIKFERSASEIVSYVLSLVVLLGLAVYGAVRFMIFSRRGKVRLSKLDQ